MAILKVKVITGAKKNEIAGMWQDMIKIKVNAQPEAGKANKACIELLADKLGISKSRIQITKGHSAREKLIQIEGLTEININGIKLV